MRYDENKSRFIRKFEERRVNFYQIDTAFFRSGNDYSGIPVTVKVMAMV